MARQSSTSSKSKQGSNQRAASANKRSSSKSSSSKRGQAKAASPAQKKAEKAAPAQEEAADERVFDDRTRRDVAGVAIAVIAVALLVTAVVPADGVVTSALSEALHLSLGLGAYLLPVVLIIIGVSFLLRTGKTRVTLRLTVGLALIFVAVLSLLSLFAPATSSDPSIYLFDEETLVERGGYVGSGIAWAGLTLFGKPVSCVILVGVILIGLAIIGLSISRLADHVRASREEKREREEQEETEPAPPFVRMQRSDAGKVPVIPTIDDSLDDEPTSVLPAGSEPTQALPASDQKTQKLTRSEKKAEKKAEKAAAKEQKEAEKTLRLQTEQATEALPEAPAAAGRRDPTLEEGTTAVLTRKLGHKKDEEPESSSKRTAATASVPTPVASPSPDEEFVLPSMDLLKTSRSGKGGRSSESELADVAALLQETLEDFGIMAEVVGWVAGPTVTLFKIDLPSGVRVSRVTGLTDDIALALASPGVRIFAPVPGTNYVGIEVPNRKRQNVLLGDVLPEAGPGPLQIAIGKDVEGHSIISDLAKMPHLLIGGTTGSGKSVAINSMIMSILMRATPSEVRFILIDPKRVEFTPYNGIPHLYVPVVTEPKEAASALSWGVAEMERRLKVFSKAGARNIQQYNAKVQAEIAAQKQAEAAGEEPPAGELGAELPYIVIVIDELADLMMNVGKEVEFSISRIAQLARAAGIHLIVATQRPSTNVVTGLIKANITNRIAFNVASSIDSRVILDSTGAENLIGLGDMLFSKPEYSKPQRIQGCYVSEDEINAVVSVLKEQAEPDYHSEILQTNLITIGASSTDGSDGTVSSDDPLLWEAADIVVSSGLGSTSNIQRRLKVGYSRAGRIMDQLEEKGVVGPPNGSKPREVLVDELELESLKAFEQQDALDPDDDGVA